MRWRTPLMALFACALSACALPTQSIVPHDSTAPLPEPDTATSVHLTPTSAPDLTVGFGNRNQIDDRYTCAGANVSPFLAWDDVPDGTVETVVMMMGDAPQRGPAREHVQWAVAGIDPSVRSIAEGSTATSTRAGGCDHRAGRRDVTQSADLALSA